MTYSYKVIEDYDKTNIENCLSYYDGSCHWDWSDFDCNKEYLTALEAYDYGWSSEDPDKYMSLWHRSVCEKNIPDYSLQDQCIQEIDYNAFNQQLNI